MRMGPLRCPVGTTPSPTVGVAPRLTPQRAPRGAAAQASSAQATKTESESVLTSRGGER
jgi:hypothetical protein